MILKITIFVFFQPILEASGFVPNYPNRRFNSSFSFQTNQKEKNLYKLTICDFKPTFEELK